MIVNCPKCGIKMESESIGWKCKGCKGFVDVIGEFHEHVERPFMPPKTNLENMQSMSAEDFERVCGHQSLCSYIQEWDKEHCESQDECNGCIKAWLEKEVKNERT